MQIDIRKYRDGHIHFIGCGGVGMVGLALIMHELGYSVSGSDMASSSNTMLLESRGVKVFIGHSVENVPKDSFPLLVVRSSAVNEDNPEYCEARKLADCSLRRGEMLAKVADLYKCSVAITGTHGKTSVTALLVYILKSAGLNPGYMVGGKVKGWATSAAAGDGALFITESDESDGTQVYMNPTMLAVTNIEGDHSWTLGGEDVLMKNFAKIATNAESVIFNSSDSTCDLLGGHPDATPLVFKALEYDDMEEWGGFQKENANLAVECAVRLGVSRDVAECEVRKFSGVERRMSLRYRNEQIILIEDYAHHPTEVRGALETLRQRFPRHRLSIVFQPHRHARLAKYLDEFAEELSSADRVWVAPVFAAWQESGDVTSADLAEKIGSKAELISGEWAQDAKVICSSLQAPEVIAVLGAGDIDMIIGEIISEI